MAPEPDKSDAAKTLDSLTVGDVIRLPNHYTNALAVVETTEIGVRVAFVDDSLAARGNTKDLIRSKYTGEYGLVAGTTDKGTVWTVEVVTRTTDDADDETEVATDGGEDMDRDDEDEADDETIRADVDLRPVVDGDVLHDLAPDYGMGAGGLKGLLAFPSPDRWDDRETEAVEAAIREQADREGLTRDAFLRSVYADADADAGDDPDADDDGDDDGETFRMGDRVALDEWGMGTVTGLPADRDDGLVRLRFDRADRDLTIYLNRPAAEVDLVERATDDGEDDEDDEGGDVDRRTFMDGAAFVDAPADAATDDAEDLVEFAVQFERPVTGADLAATFQALADAAAEEADGDVTPSRDPDADAREGDPVETAEAFEAALREYVEAAIRDGVHPADASTVLFGEANDLAASLWSPDRDDAEIVP